MSTPELALELGFPFNEISKSIFILKQNQYIMTQTVTDGRNGSSITKHYITEAGQQLVPRNRNPLSPQGRKYFAKNRPRVEGYHHVPNGPPGKIDLKKPLKGARGQVYAAITRPMTARDISVASNLQMQQTWNALNQLTKLGIVEYTTTRDKHAKGPVRLYTQKISVPVHEDIMQEEPPRPNLQPAAQLDKNNEADRLVAAVAATKKVNGQDLDGLLADCDPLDVILAMTARIENELVDLRDFKSRVLKNLRSLKEVKK